MLSQEKKTIPLNEENLIWCSGECKSCSVDQLVAFVPRKNAVKKLKGRILTIIKRCIQNLLTFKKHYQNQLDQCHLNQEREKAYKQ
jgi:hypothetical protein